MIKLPAKILLIAATFLTLISFTQVSAQENGGITLRPSFIEVDANPGDTLLIELEVENHNDSTLKIEPKFYNSVFGETPEEGITSLDDSDTEPATWVTYESEEDITISATETKRIPFKISIPEGAESKGHYPVIALEFVPEGSTGNIGTNARIGSTVYLNVKGENNEKKVDIETFLVHNKFSFYPKVNFELTLQNTGNTHVRPRASLEVFDPVDVRQSNLLTFNDDFKFLIPTQSISEDFDWSDDTIENKIFPPIGKYSGIVKVYSEDDTQTPISQDEIEFWVIPPQYIAIGGVLILSIVLVSVIVIKKGKKKSKKEN